MFKKIFSVDFISGNYNLEKWSATSVRRAGLCADHFSEDSFITKGKIQLKRGSVPLPFRNIANVMNEDANSENMPMDVEVTEIGNTKENVTETTKKYENVTRPTIFANVEEIHENITEQSQYIWPPLRTYWAPQLEFNKVSQNEDEMEWMHIEPPLKEIIPVQKCQTKTIRNKKEPQKNEKSKTQIIDNLKRENLRLRQTIKKLKVFVKKFNRRMPVKRTNKKNKKKLLQELIDENKLHPVAKAMINLQLHTPHAPYTEEEKNISKQLYYYSASALRNLRKAGCNFLGERTLRRWHEEYDMMPGFCDFIICKLQEKFSKISAQERVCALK
ncbi:uncharacterized protein LOC113561820 [Ooceraea biroi]|uniref:uncharacterized protein LOC113561820 n=1 Tax=Ooceraea biroi TaxID=2015173 RepID=UPI000F080BA8|nr:uncharacterized protein LOC113561820 [Ooceraea biroi]